MPEEDIPLTVPKSFVADFLSRLGYALTEVRSVQIKPGRIAVERFRLKDGSRYPAGKEVATVTTVIAIEDD